MCLHFLTFSLRLHLSHHCIILLISFCKAKMSVSSLINLHSLVSSANNITSDSVALGRSLTNNKNVRGPIIDPCGTPEITDVQSDFTPLI